MYVATLPVQAFHGVDEPAIFRSVGVDVGLQRLPLLLGEGLRSQMAGQDGVYICMFHKPRLISCEQVASQSSVG